MAIVSHLKKKIDFALRTTPCLHSMGMGDGGGGGPNSSLIVFGLAVYSVAGSILLWGNFTEEGIFPLELTWVQTPFPKKLFWMRV